MCQHACVSVCVCVRVRACVCMCERACAYVCVCVYVGNQHSYPEQVKKPAGKRKGPATGTPKAAAVAKTQPVEPARRSGRSQDDNTAAVDLCGEGDKQWGKRGHSKTGGRISSVTGEPDKVAFELAVKELRRAVGELCVALPTHDSKAHT